MDYFILNKKLIIRKEFNNGIIISTVGGTNYCFYVSKGFQMFENYLETPSIFCISNPQNLRSIEFLYGLSNLIKYCILENYINPKFTNTNKQIIELEIPQLIELFISPTIHYRKFYQNV
ncbi:MAG: hypothetical protein V3575_04290 [Candidatus Absconditabacteria bacterium]